MDCCGEDSSTVSVSVQQSTFAQIFNRIHSLVYSILDGSILKEDSEANNDPSVKEERHEAIVSLLFILHVTVVFFFIAHHCTPRARGASFH